MSRYTVDLATPDDIAGWRDAARRLIQANVAPDEVTWREPGAQTADLFAAAPAPLPKPDPTRPVRGSRRLLALADRALLHRDHSRFDLLYRLLWRLQTDPTVLDRADDEQIHRAEGLARIVRRDIHKMRAFVRFRDLPDPDGTSRMVAWFEPGHHILRANAGFFVRRFATMTWSILTPAGALHWDGHTLREGPPATRADAAGNDPVEALWRQYYASIFNPARVKIGAMLKEMPRKYWKNLPEAALIPDLIAGAQAREAAMIAAGTAPTRPTPTSLTNLAALLPPCRACAIGCNGTRPVPGHGNPAATLMIVGEQPGDHEEAQGTPFIGPAGQLLRHHLTTAGLDPAQVWLTNAVKHFKHTPTPQRRLHQTPTADEIDHCRWWLDHERRLLPTPMVLALGASATRGLLGRSVSVQAVRGRALVLPDGAELWITTHPSYLLRLDGDAALRETARFAADLALVAGRVRDLEEERVASGGKGAGPL